MYGQHTAGRHPVACVGAGTGLGVCFLVPLDDGRCVHVDVDVDVDAHVDLCLAVYICDGDVAVYMNLCRSEYV